MQSVRATLTGGKLAGSCVPLWGACVAPAPRCACGRPAAYTVATRAPSGRFDGPAERACAACAFMARQGAATRVRALGELQAACAEPFAGNAQGGAVDGAIASVALAPAELRARAYAAARVDACTGLDTHETLEKRLVSRACAPSSGAKVARTTHILGRGAKSLCGVAGPWQHAIPDPGSICLSCARIERARGNR